MIRFKNAVASRTHSKAQSYSFQHTAVGHLLGANYCAVCWGSIAITTWFLPSKA